MTRPRCPVCTNAGEQKMLESYSVVLTGAEAHMHGDTELVNDVQTAFTPLDAHAAVGLYVKLILEVQQLLGPDVFDPFHYLAEVRGKFNDRMAKLARQGTNTDSSSSDGSGG